MMQYLAVYGSLAPERANHHHVEMIAGTWRRGWVEGVLHAQGWGAAQGFPGIRLEVGGPRVDVDVLESADLEKHWDRLDSFEGDEYRRVEVAIHGLGTAPVRGWIYALTDGGGEGV